MKQNLLLVCVSPRRLYRMPKKRPSKEWNSQEKRSLFIMILRTATLQMNIRSSFILPSNFSTALTKVNWTFLVSDFENTSLSSVGMEILAGTTTGLFVSDDSGMLNASLYLHRLRVSDKKSNITLTEKFITKK